MFRMPAPFTVPGDFSHESTPEPSNVSAFFCSTPYQIIVAVTILTSLGSDVQADIYVLNHFRSAEEVVPRLDKSGLFRRSVLVDSRGLLGSLEKSRPKRLGRWSLLRQLQYTLCFLDYRRIAQRYCSLDNFRYSDVYFSFPDLIIQLATKVLFDRTPGLRVHLFEDGAGGYDAEISRATRKKSLFNIATGYGRVLDAYTDLLVFQPELVSDRISLPVLDLPPIARRSEVVRSLSELFQYRAAAPVAERFIFFEQPLMFVPGFDEKLAGIVLGTLPLENTLVKLHPRSKSREYGGLPVYPDAGVPWEIVAINLDLADKILVTFSSTAAVTAKTILNEEPVIIFLNNVSELNQDTPSSDGFREFVERFRLSYSDPSRVHVPGNVGEFGRIVEDLDRPTSRASWIDS